MRAWTIQLKTTRKPFDKAPVSRAPLILAEVHRLHLWEFQAVRDLCCCWLALALLWLGWRLSSITVPMLVALGVLLYL